MVTCILDCDGLGGKGRLSFRIDGGPQFLGLSGFPHGRAMRPWAWLYHADEDQVSIRRRLRSCPSASDAGASLLDHELLDTRLWMRGIL